VARVLAEGPDCYIERQIAAEDPDDGLELRLADCPGIHFSAAHIIFLHQSSAFSRSPIEGALDDLRSAKVIRAVHANNQLAEVLVDFWYNHFNVYAYAWEPSVPAFEREAIRPHALGRFRDLLGAVAAHPAMLFYLDNYLSAGPRLVNGKSVVGLNENYGRELLELHTVGVDAGYAQRDVFDAARTFTGWGIEGLADRGPPTYQFCFRPELHDRGTKEVFGLRIAAGGGQEDGEALLDHLAAHPASARFVSSRLVQRFVADDPPESLVTRCAATFLSTDGNIRSMLETIFRSEEFAAAREFGTKVKSPFDFVASSVRALGLEVRDGRGLVSSLADMGMPLYGCKPPTGYSNRGRDWLNPASQVARFDLAFRLAAGAIAGVAPGPETRTAPVRAAGLALAGPPFQMR